MIESAILAERQSQNNASVSHSNIFSKVSFEKIGEFTRILQTKNSTHAREWLQTKENYSELETGAILHNSLKHQLKIQKPFGCSNLKELESCLSTFERLHTTHPQL